MTPRPTKHAHEKRSEPLQLRLTTAERECIRAGARVAGQKVSVFIRAAAIEKATKLTGREPPKDD